MGQGALELALDEGEGIVNEGLADAVALGGDPVQGDLALGVGGLGEGSGSDSRWRPGCSPGPPFGL